MKILQDIKRLFSLPTPKELGWSDHNSLALREFTPDCKEPTWEFYYDEMKRLYPVSFFLVKTVPDFVRYNIWFPVYWPINDAWYWVVSHIVPSRRYHWLDLSQPDTDKGSVDYYRYGWSDVRSRMLFAMFNLLCQFVKYELANFYCPTEEEVIQEPALKTQREVYLEAAALHTWWVIDRKEEWKKYDQMLTVWSASKKEGDPQVVEYWEQLNKMEEANSLKEDEMAERLLKIRKGLWT